MWFCKVVILNGNLEGRQSQSIHSTWTRFRRNYLKFLLLAQERRSHPTRSQNRSKKEWMQQVQPIKYSTFLRADSNKNFSQRSPAWTDSRAISLSVSGSSDNIFRKSIKSGNVLLHFENEPFKDVSKGQVKVFLGKKERCAPKKPLKRFS